MIYFHAIIHKDEDSCYGLSFPDVAGCFSAGDTIAEAVRNGSEALQLHLSDEEEISEPRGLDELAADPEVAAELAEGGVLVAVPYLQLSGKQVRANISLDSGMLKAIDEAAKAHGMNRSAFLVSCAQLMMNIKPAA